MVRCYSCLVEQGPMRNQRNPQVASPHDVGATHNADDGGAKVRDMRQRGEVGDAERSK